MSEPCIPWSAECNCEQLNEAFIAAIPMIDLVIRDRSINFKGVYRDLVGSGPFPLGQGYIQRTEVFYGGVGTMAGLTGWSEVQQSRAPGTNGEGDPGHDSCRYESETVGYGFKEKQFRLYEKSKRTLDICLNDIKYKWQFEQQLAKIFSYLANVTLMEWETFKREWYMFFANKYLVAPGLPQFTYDPLVDTTISIPKVTGDAMGQLSQSVLDHFYLYLSRQCPAASLGMMNGMPIFGLITSPETSNELLAREAIKRPLNSYFDKFQIEGFGVATTYRGYAHMFDMNTPRWIITGDDGTTYTLTRVVPYKTSPTTVGEAINVDPAYVNAEFEESNIYLKNVYEVLTPPAGPAAPGGGTSFGTNPTYMGDFRWLNIQHRCENLLNEKGFFFARYQGSAKPLEYSTDAVSLLHRRCPDESIVICSSAPYYGAEGLGQIILGP